MNNLAAFYIHGVPVFSLCELRLTNISMYIHVYLRYSLYLAPFHIRKQQIKA